MILFDNKIYFFDLNFSELKASAKIRFFEIIRLKYNKIKLRKPIKKDSFAFFQNLN